jgi:hypothetical protein
MADYKSWLFGNDDIRPFVYMRRENQPKAPGQIHEFEFPKNVEFINPTSLETPDFATMLLALENTAFKSIGLTLPRWALYDCSIMPGLICGFVHRTSKLPASIRKVLPVIDSFEWTPLSLFICIPSNEKDHWVACNLCSVNSLLPKADNYSCLGFLSKAFGLWYCNIEKLYGVTQWKNQALSVHTSYGLFQLVTAFTPVHNIPQTLTYLVDVDSALWHRFVETENDWANPLQPAGFSVEPDSDASLISLHHRIEKGEGPFYLSPDGDYKAASQIPIFFK